MRGAAVAGATVMTSDCVGISCVATAARGGFPRSREVSEAARAAK
jgi:hypothetical protein